VVEYRRFRNTDPPGLVQVWNDAFTGRGTVRMRTSSPLERHTFAKPYFDPGGLILAEEDGICVGFVHAGFGADPAGERLSTDAGVICAIAVKRSHQRRGVGSELLRRAEEYLRGRGAKHLVAGPLYPLDPFYLGLYGGSDLPGFLASDAAAEPFLAKHGYRPSGSVLVLQRRLTDPLRLADPRQAALRPRYELTEEPFARLGSWWRECVFGLIEPLQFALADRQTGERVARANVWEMEGFSYLWNRPAVGITDVEVSPALRRKGVGKLLLAQVLRHLQEHYYEIAEAHAPEGDAAAVGLLRKLGFEQVDVGRTYHKQD
jgi:ribosomal protein S18 acetylase RimI-like enzyme